jgi:hypothetical protein
VGLSGRCGQRNEMVFVSPPLSGSLSPLGDETERFASPHEFLLSYEASPRS